MKRSGPLRSMSSKRRQRLAAAHEPANEREPRALARLPVAPNYGGGLDWKN